MQASNKNITVVSDSDLAFAEQLFSYPVMLKQFYKSGTVVIEAENQNKILTMETNSYPILVKDIMVVAYCQLGAWETTAGITRDKITVSIKSGNTDDYFMEEGIDILAFSPSINRRITPHLWNQNSNLKIEFKHVRAVSELSVNFPKINIPMPANQNTWYVTPSPDIQSPAYLTPNPMPITLQIIINGSKIFRRTE